MAVAFYEGKLFRIKVAGKTIFHETDFKLSSSLDFKELASKDLSSKQRTPGDLDWNISCSSLIGNTVAAAQEDAATLYAKHIAKVEVAIEFTTAATGDMVFTGNAFVSQFDLDATHDDVARGSFSFVGNGDLALGVVA